MPLPIQNNASHHPFIQQNPENQAVGVLPRNAAGPGAPEIQEGELLTAVRDMLGNGRTFSDFNIRHTRYGAKERFLHFISFGVKYSDVRKAYYREMALERTFAQAAIEIQERLSAMPPEKSASFGVSVGNVLIRVEQDASGHLTAQIGHDDDFEVTTPFELPFTAAQLSSKMVNDMLARPECYPKNALLHSVESDLKYLCNPVRREVYETILQQQLGIVADEVSQVSNVALRHLAKMVLTGEFKTRDDAMAHIENGLQRGLYLQETCRINDEQAAALTDNFEQALAADAARVARSVNIEALIAKPEVDAASEAAISAARKTRIHELMADLVLNREAAVYDKHLSDPGERLRATMLKHIDAMAEILSGDASVLDTLGNEVAEPLRAPLLKLQQAWRTANLIGNPKPLAETFLRNLPASLFQKLDTEIEEAVTAACGHLKESIHQALAGVRQTPELPTRAQILATQDPQERIRLFCQAHGTLFKAIAAHPAALGKLSQNVHFLSGSTILYSVYSTLNFAKLPSDVSEATVLETLNHGLAIDENMAKIMSDDISAFMSPGGTYDEMMAEFNALVEPHIKPTLDDMMTESFDPDSGYGKLIFDVMEHYFDTDAVNQDRAVDRRGMVASYLRYTRFGEGSDPSPGAILGAVFKGAGPIMQKALQGLDASALDEELGKAVADMKSSLAPIDPSYVQAQLLDIVERSRGEITNIKINRSLGAASVGQAFLCTVTKRTGETSDCVLKLLRPDVRNKAMRERAIFEHYAAGIPGMSATFAGNLERILAELDLTAEAANAETGKIYEDAGEDKRVCSMTVLNAVAPAPGALLLERAAGQDLAAFTRKSEALLSPIAEDIARGRPVSTENLEKVAQHLKDLKEVHRRLETLSERWVTEGIFGKGFYHGDLHAGNIMIDVPDRTENPDGDVGELTVIDYGNATSLSKDQQKQVMVVMAGATFRKAEWFQDGYLKLLDDAGRRAFEAADTVATKDGFLMDAEGERITGADGNFIRVGADGLIEGTQKKAPGRLTAMINRIMEMGDITDTAKRIAVALTLLQQHGIDCPGPIFNFSACQIRLQNAVDGIFKQMENTMACVVRGAKARLDAPDAAHLDDDERTRLEALKNTKVSASSFVGIVGDVLASRRTTFVHNIGLMRGIEAARIINNGEF